MCVSSRACGMREERRGGGPGVTDKPWKRGNDSSGAHGTTVLDFWCHGRTLLPCRNLLRVGIPCRFQAYLPAAPPNSSEAGGHSNTVAVMDTPSGLHHRCWAWDHGMNLSVPLQVGGADHAECCPLLGPQGDLSFPSSTQFYRSIAVTPLPIP